MTAYTTGSNGLPRTTVLTGAVAQRSDAKTEIQTDPRITGGRQKRPDDARRREVDRALARAQTASKPFDRSLLDQISELLETVDPDDQVTATVNLAEAGTMVAELWETAGDVTAIHRMILAALDTGILAALAADLITDEHLHVFREALGDLSMNTVSEAQAEAIRSRLIDLGKKPLFLLNDSKEGLDDDRDE